MITVVFEVRLFFGKMISSFSDQKIDEILKYFDFIKKFSTSSHQGAENLLKEASHDELRALINCLALRTHVENYPLSKKDNIFIRKACRSKKSKKYLKNKCRYILPLIACVLVKILQEVFLYIYDSA